MKKKKQEDAQLQPTSTINHGSNQPNHELHYKIHQKFNFFCSLFKSIININGTFNHENHKSSINLSQLNAIHPFTYYNIIVRVYKNRFQCKINTIVVVVLHNITKISQKLNGGIRKIKRICNTAKRPFRYVGTSINDIHKKKLNFFFYHPSIHHCFHIFYTQNMTFPLWHLCNLTSFMDVPLYTSMLRHHKHAGSLLHYIYTWRRYVLVFILLLFEFEYK